MNKRITLLFILAFTIVCNSQEAYYNDVNLNLTGLTLKEELATKIISTHTQFLFYDQVWDASKATDINPNNSEQVLLIYGYENGTDSDVTNDRERGINQNGGNSGDWNREHVFSQSLGVPALSDSGPGSDAHHLRPADAQRNSSRNNRKFTAGTGNSGTQANAGWYPGDEWKGDVARMMMYMYVRYGDRCLPTNIGIGDNSMSPDDMIDLFLQWNVEDPVSDFERQRNTYHENTSNQNAQGNRNPFIDNPILATRIWGGEKAEDTWGIYTNFDTEAPSVPTNISLTNITTFSIDVAWDASSDNIGVTSYDVYVNGNLEVATSNTFLTISNLKSDTDYSIAILAKDIVNNTSDLSEPIDVRTLPDIQEPTIPQNLIISNETESSFVVSWTPSSDDTAVVLYEVYLENILLNSTSSELFTIVGLSPSTSYSVAVLAADEAGNKSELSESIIGTTTNGTALATELFFSEYYEGSFGSNKALEIVNLTATDVNMSEYSIKRQTNGGLDGSEWEYNLPLTGILKTNDVYVIINSATTVQKLVEEADFVQPHSSETNFGAPISFNGNDPVGLFKNNELIDIIGIYNGGSSNFAKDKTLRRKSGVSQPNTVFDLDNEWDVVEKDNAEDFGTHSAIVLGIVENDILSIQVYPNPVENFITILNPSNKLIQKITIFNVLGKVVFHQKNPGNNININKISIGIYMITFEIDNKIFTKRIIKN